MSAAATTRRRRRARARARPGYRPATLTTGAPPEFRFPGSKFDPEILAADAKVLADLAQEAGADIELFLGLPGSKTRLTNESGFDLRGIDRLELRFEPVAADRDRAVPLLGLTGPAIPVSAGDTLVLGDGEDALRVIEAFGDHCVAAPLTSGILVFDAVILSFVETPETIETARSLMREGRPGKLPWVIAKVETRAGVALLREIAESADAILLGRGDLLLDTGEVDFYDLQRDVMKPTIEQGKPYRGHAAAAQPVRELAAESLRASSSVPCAGERGR
jgi:pyruvate kinase